MAASPETEALRKDFEQLRSDFSDLSQDLKKETVTGARVGAEKAREGAQYVEHEIEAHPFTSLAAAFGVGLLLGKLSSR